MKPFLVAAASLVGWAVLSAQSPDVREVWVPDKALAKALQGSPKAVLLTREQWETLRRDSRPPKPPEANTPPVAALVRSAEFTGSLARVIEGPLGASLPLRAVVSVDVLGAEWTELPLPLPDGTLSAVSCDGETAVQACSGEKQVLLALRGAGRHTVTLDFAAPLADSAGVRQLTLTPPGSAEARLVLEVPAALAFKTELPFERRGDTVTVALPAAAQPVTLGWSARDLAPLETGALFQRGSFVYTIDAARLHADLALTLQSTLREVPAAVKIPLPAEANILAVTGPELARWTWENGTLGVEFQPGARRSAEVSVSLDLPVDPAKPLVLPTPQADVARRASGSWAVRLSPELRLRSLVAGPLTTRDDSAVPRALAESPGFFGAWAFPVTDQAVEVTLEPLQAKLVATQDTQVAVGIDAVTLTRHVSFTAREGTAFSPTLSGLAPAEQVETVTGAQGDAVPFRRSGDALVFPTPAGLAPGAPFDVTLVTRLVPDGWTGLREQKQASFSVPALKVPGAEKLSGYVAVSFDDSLRVTPVKADGLEPRDPRPLAAAGLDGRLAWFRLDDFTLELSAVRRAPRIDAEVAVQALPLLNSLEAEGRVRLSISQAPLRTVRVLFPKDAAPAVRWDSDLISEKSLADDGTWTLKFQEELSGTASLRFRWSAALAEATAAGEKDAPRRFQATLVPPTVPEAARTDGTVAIEANTDTELTFTAPAPFDPLDTARVPALEGYSARHRLVAAFAWRGVTGSAAPSLGIDGVRHPAGSLATTVIDSLRLDSVVSPDGPVRHQARLRLRTSADQFLDLTMPAEARLLTLKVDSQPAKPLKVPSEGAEHVVRVQLPSANGSATLISLVYETPGLPLEKGPRPLLRPLVLPARLPVLQTEWQLHLPEGFSYSDFDSDLTRATQDQAVPALASVVSQRLAEPEAWELLASVAPDSLIPRFAWPKSSRNTQSVDAVYAAARAAGTEDDEAEATLQLMDQARSDQEKKVAVARDRLQQLIEQYKVIDLNPEGYRGGEGAPQKIKIEGNTAMKDGMIRREAAAAPAAETEPLKIEYPKAQFVGTPVPVDGAATQPADVPFVSLSGDVPRSGDFRFTEGMTLDYLTGASTNRKFTVERGGRKFSLEGDTAAQFRLEAGDRVEAAYFDGTSPVSGKAYGYNQLPAGSDLRSSTRDIAEREVLRRQERGASAAEREVAGDKAFAQKDWSGAVDLYRATIDVLSAIPAAADQRERVSAKFADARVKLAQQHAEGGEYVASRTLLNSVLSDDADNRSARKLLAQLDDPEYFGPAKSKEHQANVAESQRQLDLAQGHYDLGEYDKAAEAYKSVLAMDRYSVAARLGLEKVERRMAEHHLSSREQTRATMLRQTDELWETAVPTLSKLGPLKSGLLPLEFDLPDAGRVISFRGAYAPGPISFRAETWESQVRRAWWLMVAASGAYLLLARRRPWIVGLLGIITLHFTPLLLEKPEWLVVTNALLLGWSVTFAVGVLIRGLARISDRINPPVRARKQEVAHA